MAYLQFNKAELVNLEYSLKREVIAGNKTGAYINTTIVCCNTRKYHGLLVVPIDYFGGDKYVLLSSLDETLVKDGKEFHLGIHNYGEIFEPRGHKYIVDYEMTPNATFTYMVGDAVIQKSFVFSNTEDQLLIKYTLLDAQSSVALKLKPFLAFRATHSLTKANNDASTRFIAIENGCSFKLYEGFPDLNLQFSKSVDYVPCPDWYRDVQYMEEARRGFESKEDLYVPGFFELTLKKGETIVVSASTKPTKTSTLKQNFAKEVKIRGTRDSFDDCLRISANQFLVERNGQTQVCSGYSWMHTGMLRDTCIALPGLTLYNGGDVKRFEKTLDDLIKRANNLLVLKSYTVDAPLRLAELLQNYVDFTSNGAKIWSKYGKIVKEVVESYIKGRPEVQLHSNGLLWAEYHGKALSWMNAYSDGHPITERNGYQVETNALWYNMICFVIEMEKAYSKSKKFANTCEQIKDRIDESFYPTFWSDKVGHLADYVGRNGQVLDTRPNQIYVASLKYSPVSEEVQAIVLHEVKEQLLTSRGIRTLSPKNPLYKGVYEGNQYDRDMAYHNGSTAVWLLGPYVAANFKLRGKAFISTAKSLVAAFEEDLTIHGIGAVAEIYDGNPPHFPHGAISSATATAEILRIKHLINKYSQE